MQLVVMDGMRFQLNRLPNCSSPRDSGPSAATLTCRLSMLCVVGCFGWLVRRATLAYELYWNCDCLEAPRPSAADSRRQFPSAVRASCSFV
jgi:hypothetical protein